MTEYRNEWKYICTEIDLELLRRRIASLMPLDKNQKGMSSYNIRSLYFDDQYNSCFAANSEGIFFGIPQFEQIDEYGNEDFADDMALYSFAEYVVAKVVSKPRKYKKHKCFDIEISVKD